MKKTWYKCSCNQQVSSHHKWQKPSSEECKQTRRFIGSREDWNTVFKVPFSFPSLSSVSLCLLSAFSPDEISSVPLYTGEGGYMQLQNYLEGFLSKRRAALFCSGFQPCLKQLLIGCAWVMCPTLCQSLCQGREGYSHWPDWGQVPSLCWGGELSPTWTTWNGVPKGKCGFISKQSMRKAGRQKQHKSFTSGQLESSILEWGKLITILC